MDGVKSTATDGVEIEGFARLIENEEPSELDLLREFYRSWVAFHKIPRDSLHRKKMEAASQLMVDNAHAVAAFYRDAAND